MVHALRLFDKFAFCLLCWLLIGFVVIVVVLLLLLFVIVVVFWGVGVGVGGLGDWGWFLSKRLKDVIRLGWGWDRRTGPCTSLPGSCLQS